jgi:hypothetical protein
VPKQTITNPTARPCLNSQFRDSHWRWQGYLRCWGTIAPIGIDSENIVSFRVTLSTW